MPLQTNASLLLHFVCLIEIGRPEPRSHHILTLKILMCTWMECSVLGAPYEFIQNDTRQTSVRLYVRECVGMGWSHLSPQVDREFTLQNIIIIHCKPNWIIKVIASINSRTKQNSSSSRHHFHVHTHKTRLSFARTSSHSFSLSTLCAARSFSLLGVPCTSHFITHEMTRNLIFYR